MEGDLVGWLGWIEGVNVWWDIELMIFLLYFDVFDMVIVMFFINRRV